MEVQDPQQSNDQQQFDEQVNRVGGLVLKVLAGVGIFAAVTMSTIALLETTGANTTSTVTAAAAAPAATALPTSARIAIDHATKGCHTLAVNGGLPGKPSATLHLATGATLNLVNNDVMPHRLVLVSGPQAQMANVALNHMSAKTAVTFPAAGTYKLTTKAGEDYSKGIVTTGADNTLRITVVVGSPTAGRAS